MLVIVNVQINYVDEQPTSANVYYRASSNTQNNLSGNVLIPPAEYTGEVDVEILKPIVLEKIHHLLFSDPPEDDPALDNSTDNETSAE